MGTTNESETGSRISRKESDLEKAAGDEELHNISDDSNHNSAWSNHEEPVHDNIVVAFEENDASNPYNWSRSKKLYCAITSMALVLNSAMGSAIPSGAIPTLQKYFDLGDSDSLLVLPNSLYLFGYMLGPLGFAPLSESYGRKWVMVSTFAMFTLFVLGCALANSYATFIVCRLFAGIGASTPMSVIGGVLADLYKTPRARGTAIVWFMSFATWGPITGPILSGYITPTFGWRWVFWAELIIAGVTWPFVLLLPETYGPVLLTRRARKLREETGNSRILAPAELEKRDLWEIITKVLTRPIRMFLFESIVLFSCLYLSLAYGIFYGFFQAYDPIFGKIYGFSTGEVGLAFLPIGIGALIAAFMYLWWDWFLDKNQRKVNPPAWSHIEEFVRLPLACIGGPLIAISAFWLGWTARSDVHWIVPVLSSLPFGCGFLLIFLALSNYVVDAYDVFAASAMAAISSSRSIAGAVIPFATRPMYDNLGVNWACTVWGFIGLVMCLIPFAFLKYGARIRANSKFSQELKRQKENRSE